MFTRKSSQSRSIDSKIQNKLEELSFTGGKEFYNQNGVYSPWGDKIDYDPIQFGLTNKNSKVIKTLLRYLFEQKFISKTPDLESLFVEGSKDFID